MRPTSLLTGPLILAAAAKASNPLQAPAETPVPGSMTSAGCFSDAGHLNVQPVEGPLASGTCANVCKSSGYPVMALHGYNCYCGTSYPPKDTLTDDDNCNHRCPGYPDEACGGLNGGGHRGSYYSVWNLGTDRDAGFEDGEGSDDKHSTSKESLPATNPITTPATSATPEPSTTASDDSKPSGTATETPAPSKPGDNGSAGLNSGALVGSAIFGVAAAVAGAAYL